MEVSQLVQRTEGVELSGWKSGDREVRDVRFDSRRVGPGDLFAALEGRNEDGHDYLDEAAEAGAAALMVAVGRRDEAPPGIPVLVADHPRRRLGPVAARVHGRPAEELDIVGVTGTNGKTTTTALVASILEADGRNVGRIGTTGHRWGGEVVEGRNTTPESATLHRLLARMLADGVDTVAMEVSSHGLATHRLRGLSVDCAVLTNLSQDHLDFHGDMAEYRRAKASLFRHYLDDSSGEGTVVLNAGDDFGAELIDELEGSEDVGLLAYGVGARSAETSLDVVGRRIELGLEGVAFDLELDGETRSVETSLVGEFNVENSLAAAGGAWALGASRGTVVEGLEETDGVEGRAERVAAGVEGAPAVFVDYAHTPDALERILETVGRVTEGQLVVVFGCGGDRDREKRPEMGRIGAELADLAVVTSDNPRSEERSAIIDEMLEGVDEPVASGEKPPASGVWVDPDRRRALRAAIREASEGDVVLVAGKGHETYQEVDGEMREFDDAREVAAALDEQPKSRRRGERDLE